MFLLFWREHMELNQRVLVASHQSGIVIGAYVLLINLPGLQVDIAAPGLPGLATAIRKQPATAALLCRQLARTRRP